MRKWSKKSKLAKIIVSLGLVLLLIAIGLIAYENSALRKLERVGYNREEIETILEMVEKSDIELLLAHKYDERVDELVKDDNFQNGKLLEYLDGLDKYAISAEGLLQLVNHPDYDPVEDYSELERAILKEKYYLSRNYERYLAVARSINKKVEAAEIVAQVNSNRDREYYTEPEAADIDAGDLLLVNKYYYLGPDYDVDIVAMDAAYGQIGVEMERETYKHFQKMAEAALLDGVQLYVTSGYRDYTDQEEVFASYLAEGGEAHALVYAAKPGYSEHQTGRALDIFTPGMTLTSFAGTKGANWLANEAYKYGFVLRYPEDKVELTGYEYEPWHYRYVGEDAAKTIYSEGLSLEEYYAYYIARG